MTPNTTNKIAATVGAGLAAAGAAGYYFYASPKAKSHRRIATRWAGAMKTEVLRDVKKLKDNVSAEDVARIVDSVAAAYAGTRASTTAAIKRAATELKRNWKKVQEDSVKPARKRRAVTRIKKS